MAQMASFESKKCSNKVNIMKKIVKSSVVAFRATPTVAAQLKELAAQEQRTLSTWMNLRAQEAIKASVESAEERPVQERLL